MRSFLVSTATVDTTPKAVQVQTIFFASTTSGNSQPMLANNLDVAEQDWVTTFRLTPTTAAREWLITQSDGQSVRFCPNDETG